MKAEDLSSLFSISIEVEAREEIKYLLMILREQTL